MLDLLTAVKWDLKSGLSDGAAAPDELASNIGRMFDDIDASIDKLRVMLRERGFAVSAKPPVHVGGWRDRGSGMTEAEKRSSSPR